MSEKGKSLVTTKNLLIVVIVLFLAVVGYFTFLDKDKNILTKDNKEKTEAQSKDKYQAVFLTNGQVYFGKLNDEGGDYIKLTDIYYLQAQDQKVQPKEAASQNEPNMTLIKLGKELHAPADEMNISRTQVLFWEDIKDDGKVMQAIKEYQASNK